MVLYGHNEIWGKILEATRGYEMLPDLTLLKLFIHQGVGLLGAASVVAERTGSVTGSEGSEPGSSAISRKQQQPTRRRDGFCTYAHLLDYVPLQLAIWKATYHLLPTTNQAETPAVIEIATRHPLPA